MAGYNGAGIWDRSFNWTQDAANDIKILASRQDAEWANVVTGFNTAMTRDGQAVWTGSQNAGGKGITNLASGGTTSTNAANIGDIQLISGQWQTESNTVLFSNATFFAVIGADHTTTYTRGRRLRITHNTGATISYATVVGSSLISGNTSVQVAVDGTVPLVSTLLSVQYSFLLPDQVATPFGSCVAVTSSGALAALTSTGAYGIGSVQYPSTVLVDIFSEYSGVFFTAKYAGFYLVALNASMTKSGATITQEPFLQIQNSGIGSFGGVQGSMMATPGDGNMYGSITCVVYLGVAQTVTGVIQAPTFTGGPVRSWVANITILRVR